MVFRRTREAFKRPAAFGLEALGGAMPSGRGPSPYPAKRPDRPEPKLSGLLSLLGHSYLDLHACCTTRQDALNS